MSFSACVKEELATYSSKEIKCSILELFGILKFRGSILLSSDEQGKNQSYVFHITPIYIARRVLSLLKSLGYQEIQAVYQTNNYLECNKSFHITIPMAVFDGTLRQYFGIRFTREDWKTFLSEDILYMGDFLRGCFFVGGYIADPKKNYHLELIEKETDEILKFIQKMFKDFFHITVNIIESKKGFKLYMKNALDILAFLELTGAPVSAQKIEAIIDQRKVKADFNRTLNFTLANANKTAHSNFTQIEAIKKIQQTIGLAVLDAESKEIAALRLKNEDLSLIELDACLKTPIGKSAIHNRLKKMIKLAHLLEEELA